MKNKTSTHIRRRKKKEDDDFLLKIEENLRERDSIFEFRIKFRGRSFVRFCILSHGILFLEKKN